jgi:predicted PurR-regulated permease PerM
VIENESTESVKGTGGPKFDLTPPPAIVWALGLALAALLVYVSQDFILLLLLSATLAYLLNPIVKIAESALIKRPVAVTILYLGIGMGILIAGYFLHPRLRSEIDNLSRSLPSFGNRLDEAIDAIQGEIIAQYPAADQFLTTREFRYERLNHFIEQRTGNFPVLLSHLASMLLAAVLIPFFSYFFLRDSRKIIQSVLDRLPANYSETSVAIWREIDRIVGHYLRGVALEGMALGVTAAAGLWMLGINYPLLLGLLSGVASVVPYLGPIVGGGAAVLIAMVQYKSMGPIAQVFLLYAFIKLLDIVVIQPLAVGRGKELHPVLLIASIVVGGHALGIVGMIVAVPTVTITQRIVKLLFERRRYATSAFAAPPHAGVQIPPYVC